MGGSHSTAGLRRCPSVLEDDLIDSVIHFHTDETGQGLVEYVLMIALVAFACVAGMNSLASSLNSAFAKVGTKLGKYVS